MRTPASAPDYTARLAALIGGPVSRDAPAAPTLRPVLGTVPPDHPVVEPDRGNPSPPIVPAAKDATPESDPVRSRALAARTKASEATPPGLTEPVRVSPKPVGPPEPVGTRVPLVRDVPGLPRPVPVPDGMGGTALPGTVSPVASPVRHGQPSVAAAPAANPLPQAGVRTATSDPPPPVVAPSRVEGPRRRSVALLPGDPERLAASAARLGLSSAGPALPPAPVLPAKAGAKPEPSAAPMVSRKPSRPVDHTAGAEAEADAKARPTIPSTPKPVAAPEAIAKPADQPKAPNPPAQPALRPAEQLREALPPQPPRMAPKVRVEIGKVTLVTRAAKDPGSALQPRKSALAPVSRRSGRGHSIPRPGGL